MYIRWIYLSHATAEALAGPKEGQAEAPTALLHRWEPRGGIPGNGHSASNKFPPHAASGSCRQAHIGRTLNHASQSARCRGFADAGQREDSGAERGGEQIQRRNQPMQN